MNNKTVTKQKLEQEIRRLRIVNDAKEKGTLQLDRVVTGWEEIAKLMDAILEQKLESEYPAATPHLDIPSAVGFGGKLADSIMVEFQKLAKVWDNL